MSKEINHMKEPLSDSFIPMTENQAKGLLIVEDKGLFYLCKFKVGGEYEKIFWGTSYDNVYSHYEEKLEDLEK